MPAGAFSWLLLEGGAPSRVLLNRVSRVAVVESPVVHLKVS